MPYYRWTLTFASIQILGLIPFIILTYYLRDDAPVSLDPYIQYLLWIALYVVQIMIVELQMRYIDQIHFAKNDLIKDKQIIKRYLTSLQRVSSGASMESLQEEI